MGVESGAKPVFIKGRTGFMGTKKRVTVNAKITEEESTKLNVLAERENISVTALIRLLVDALLTGEINLEKGEIKSCPTTDEMGVSEVSEDDFMENLRFKELKLDKLASVFSEYGYPDYIVRQHVEQMISMIKDNGKFNPKRSSSEYGC